ncbi:MAG: glycosyltransferase [Alphaproteobacteria bacterium]|nr:glycosyltransferase [Alphaproteobacteria bacterium]
MPKVSVLTPIYNTNPQYLRDMIESVLNQTFTDFEFLILNDSPDNLEIEKIVLEYAGRDKRIKYSKNENNMGITPSRNKLLEMARGEYLAIFDHDDISLPDRLDKEAQYLDEHSEIGVVSSWVQYFGNKNYIRKNPETDEIIKIYMTDNLCIMHTAAMIRKSVLDENNIQYESKYTPAEDYALFARLMDKTKFHNIQDVLVKYRVFGTNTSCQQSNKINEKHDMIQQMVCTQYPDLRREFTDKYDCGTKYRLRLFGFIPLLKIKKHRVYLFEFIPLFKLKWK